MIVAANDKPKITLNNIFISFFNVFNAFIKRGKGKQGAFKNKVNKYVLLTGIPIHAFRINQHINKRADEPFKRILNDYLNEFDYNNFGKLGHAMFIY